MEFLVAIGVFAALGYLSVVDDVAVTEVIHAGVVLAFLTFPKVISARPELNSVFGVSLITVSLVAESKSNYDVHVSGRRSRLSHEGGSARTGEAPEPTAVAL